MIADNGAGAMQMLQRSTAAKLELNKRVIVREGVETPSGRRAHDRYLACLDRFVRLADRLGLTPPPHMVHASLTVTKIERVLVDVDDRHVIEYAPRQVQAQGD